MEGFTLTLLPAFADIAHCGAIHYEAWRWTHIMCDALGQVFIGGYLQYLAQ
jgi:hypothetical protein